MNDKEAIEILLQLLKKDVLDERETEAVHEAIGMLGWSQLIEGKVKTVKNARERKLREDTEE